MLGVCRVREGHALAYAARCEVRRLPHELSLPRGLDPPHGVEVRPERPHGPGSQSVPQIGDLPVQPPAICIGVVKDAGGALEQLPHDRGHLGDCVDVVGSKNVPRDAFAQRHPVPPLPLLVRRRDEEDESVVARVGGWAVARALLLVDDRKRRLRDACEVEEVRVLAVGVRDDPSNVSLSGWREHHSSPLREERRKLPASLNEFGNG
mmetsp:Transcript_30344/g.72200  ORF Transcript_30344/g.72200 Transcript_30344/m.72200 type:complete len:207 (+) Transcript_30344:1082-1702(+)